MQAFEDSTTSEKLSPHSWASSFSTCLISELQNRQEMAEDSVKETLVSTSIPYHKFLNKFLLLET